MPGVDFNLFEVSETLLLPLWGRAELTRSGNPVLVDPLAVAIIDRLDYDFSKIRADLDHFKNLSWIARARQFDDKVRAFALLHPDCTVVNLGAGLDTTFHRIDNGTMHWIDLDLPEVIKIREQLIPPKSHASMIEGSILDPSWMHQVRDRNPSSLLLMAGGVLYYLPRDQVNRLMQEIAEILPGCEFVFDIISPAGVRQANNMLRKVGMNRAEILWGIQQSEEIENWDSHLTILDRQEYFQGIRFSRIPLKSRILIQLNRRMRIMSLVHCRFNES